MLVIRYFRIGKKNQPYFKIVVTDKRNPAKGGRFVEEVGNLSPLTKKKILKADRIKYWLSVGAKPSPTVYNLLVSEKIIEGKKIPSHKKKKVKDGTPSAVAPAPTAKPAAKPAETPKVEAPVEAQAPVEEPKIEPPVEEKKIESPKA
jgi:small subunit ribosomal protein S16